MKSCILTLVLVAFAAGDVSHLANHYLPPGPMANDAAGAPQSNSGHVTTVIEKHELRELPEQIEYMREEVPAQQQQDMPENTPNMELTPPEAPMEMLGMPAARYLPPLPQPPAVPEAMPAVEPKSQVEQLPEKEYLAPEMSVMPDMPETQQQMMPATRYLPPAMELASEPMQPNYQQYQEQYMAMEQARMAEMQAAQAEEQYMMDAMPSFQQPEAPTDVETLAQQAAPAHELLDDGYHYKTIEMPEKRLRH